MISDPILFIKIYHEIVGNDIKF